jgi:Fur family transcriptional regulator, iron response regulator
MTVAFSPQLPFAPGISYIRRMNKTDSVAEKLRDAGLRPTRQRLSLAKLLFDGCDRHISAESLHAEARRSRAGVSLATVYNTLHQFKDAGLLREVAIEGERSYYDTNTSNHFHFLDEESGELSDIDPEALVIAGLPDAPKGRVIDRIDVIVRLRKT